MKDLGCPGERQRSEDAEGLARKGDGEEIALDDANSTLAQSSCPYWVRLNSNQPQRTSGKRARYRARTRAYLDNKLARRERRLIDNLVGRRRIKKVLPELAPPPVSVCPPPGGHGRTPLSWLPY